jgi:hypothetical protein
MKDLILIGVSGWLVVLLLPITITLPLRLRPVDRLAAGQRPIQERLRPHYWLGYAIATLVLIHATAATGTGVALRAEMTGMYLATGGLLLVCVQVFLGLLLRERSLRRRAVVRRRHVRVMLGIIVLALGHIALNSATLHTLVR